MYLELFMRDLKQSLRSTFYLLALILLLLTSSLSVRGAQKYAGEFSPVQTWTLYSGDSLYLPVSGAGSLTIYYSTNPSVLSVSDRGCLTAGKDGKAQIICDRCGTVQILDFLVMDSYLDDGTDTVQRPGSGTTTENIPAFDLKRTVLFMQKGDTYKAEVSFSSRVHSNLSLSWSSDTPEVAKVDHLGKITARKNGTATILCDNGVISKEIYVNVIGSSYDGNACDFTTFTSNGKTRTYRLYRQNAHNYPKYDRYLAWHGCATCSLTTVLGAYNSKYADISPSAVIDGPEKSVTGVSAWNLEHVEHSLKQQMPLSLYGISSILSKHGIDNDYVRSYKNDAGKADILSHLQDGNAVIFEVRQKSNRTGKKSQRWTNSYHTMVLLGVLTNGKVLLCDSVNRSWYKGGQRLKIVDLDDLMEFMYSCTSFSESMYFNGAASDGGYIKVYGS